MRILPFKLYQVVGESMAPLLKPDQKLLGWRWFSHLRTGQIVVLKHNQPKFLIKRLKKIKSGVVWVEGENKAVSTDSRSFGWMPRTNVEAVILTWPPTKRQS